MTSSWPSSTRYWRLPSVMIAYMVLLVVAIIVTDSGDCWRDRRTEASARDSHLASPLKYHGRCPWSSGKNRAKSRAGQGVRARNGESARAASCGGYKRYAGADTPTFGM